MRANVQIECHSGYDRIRKNKHDAGGRMRPFIVVGDRTDHGGVVVGGSPTTDVGGRMMARVGDRVTCPRKGHGGTTVIVSGDPTFVIDGQSVARHGDKCACGATLLASQVVAYFDEGGSASSSTSGASSIERSTMASHFDEQVELVTNTAFAEGLPYFIRVEGRTLAGRVGADGRLPRIDTSSASRYEVFVGDEALALIEDAKQ